jgi:hypothetical protein
MKLVLISVGFLIVWTLVGHFLPIVVLFLSFIAYPLFFFIVFDAVKFKLPFYFKVLLAFIIIFFNDYLFRLFGGGTHDDAGRAWCELSFYMTLLTTVIALIIVAVKHVNSLNNLKKSNRVSKILIFKSLCYIMFVALLTLTIFRSTTIFI